jgi:hypothetical protein
MNKRLAIKSNLFSLITSTFISHERQGGWRERSDKFFKIIASLLRTRGLRETVRYIKLMRLAVTQYLSGNKLGRLSGIKLKDGWPVKAACLKFESPDLWDLRLTLTLLTVLRDERLEPVVDLDPITSKWNGALPPIKWWAHRNILKELGIKLRRKREWSDYHMSTKMGPNGQALISSMWDLNALPLELYNDIAVIGDSPLKSHMDAIASTRWGSFSPLDIWQELYPLKRAEYLTRRISYFSDKEGKTRVIAILDYWSQTALKPYHDVLMNILKGIRTDCTFNQDHFRAVLPSTGPYFSFDLKNATDRVPISLQKRVIESIWGARKAEAWARILVKWPYHVRLPDGRRESVYYQAGQPMGAYSSWPALALTHHYLVKWAAMLVGMTNFWGYTILGDDIVIADARVAGSYRELLKILDIPISENKTHISDYMYEFAKRWVWKGSEITPFSIGGILETWKRYPYLSNFLETQHRHGWDIADGWHPGLVKSIYRILGKPQQAERVVKLYMVFREIAKAKDSGVFNEKLFTVTSQYFGIPETNLPLEPLVRGVLRRVRLNLLEHDLNNRNTYIAQAAIAQAVIQKRLLGLDDRSYRDFARKHIPLPRVVTRIGDEAVMLICQLTDPDSILDELPLYEELRKLSVSGRVFSLRTNHVALGCLARQVKDFVAELRTTLANQATVCAVDVGPSSKP